MRGASCLRVLVLLLLGEWGSRAGGGSLMSHHTPVWPGSPRTLRDTLILASPVPILPVNDRGLSKLLCTHVGV